MIALHVSGQGMMRNCRQRLTRYTLRESRYILVMVAKVTHCLEPWSTD